MSLEDEPVRVARIADIPEDSGLCVIVSGRQVALFRHGDEVFAIGNICPHQGAPLAEGFQEEGIVECPMHGWQFDLRTGRALNGTQPVPVYAVVVRGQDIFLRGDRAEQPPAVDLPRTGSI